MNKTSTSSLPKQRVNGTFYPITKEQLLWMRANKLVNNTTYVYLALKLENPFSDRPIEINVKEFTLAWGVPQSSVYKIVTKLETLNALKQLTKKLTIQWVEDFELFSSEATDSQNSQFSQKRENILKVEKKFSEVRINSQKRENQPLEPLPDKGYDSLQTLQIVSETTDSKELVVPLEFLEETQEVQPSAIAIPEVPAPTIEELPRHKELIQMGVRLNSPELIKAVAAYQGRIINPIRAFLEYATRKQVKDATAAFITAVRKGWEPDGNYDEGGLPEQENPPSVEQLAKLEEMKSQKVIADFYLSTDGVTKVIPLVERQVGKNKFKVPDPTRCLPWWEFLSQV